MPSDLPRLSDLEGLDLIREVTREEVFAVVQELPLSKSPGSDGFNTEFFHFFWSNIGGHLFSTVSYFFSNSVMPLSWGKTYVVLIPKKDNPRLGYDYCPISLYNI